MFNPIFMSRTISTSIPVTSAITSVYMAGIPAGVYFVSIDNVTTQRIVKR